MDLPDSDYDRLVAETVALVTTSEKKKKQFEAFKNYLDKHGPYEYVVDAGTVKVETQHLRDIYQRLLCVYMNAPVVSFGSIIVMIKKMHFFMLRFCVAV